jgi:hypothetical protein
MKNAIDEKQYAINRVREIRNQKINDIVNERNDAINAFIDKNQRTPDKELREKAMKSAVKKVKPVFKSLADIKKDALAQISDDPYAKLSEMMDCGGHPFGRMLMGGRCCTGMSTMDDSPIVNGKKLDAEFNKQYAKLCKADDKRCNPHENIDRKSYAKRQQAVTDEAQQLMDKIVITDNETLEDIKTFEEKAI